MSTSDLLSSTLNWPGKGVYGLKSSVLQTTESDLVKQTIVTDHMRNHYRRLHGARSAVDSKPPKSMVLGQKCRDRARKEMAQMAYTQSVLDQIQGGSVRNTPRGRSSQSARARFVQSQPTTYRARSRSIESSRMVTRSLNMNGSTQNLNQNNNTNIVDKIFGDGILTQALTSMAALGKLTSTERNKSSADVLDKHPDSFIQPEPDEHQPRLVKRDGASYLINNRAYYNPPRKSKPRPSSASKQQQSKVQEPIPNEIEQKEDEQSALREQLNRSLELRHNVEKKIKKAKATPTLPPSTTTTNSVIRKQSDEALKRFGLSEQERLQYVRFMQEITDAIIRNNLTTESAIEKLYEIHVDRNRDKLDERRLRALLEALKEDLGVRTSRNKDTYASVHKATTYDNEPLPTQVPVTTREGSLVLTPKTPHSSRRISDFDINTPLPWQSDYVPNKQSTITHEIKRNGITTNHENPLDDDHLFSPSSIPTIKPKPRLSLQNKTEDISNNKIIEEESPIPMNFNSTIRKPITDLHSVDWLTESQPTNTIIEEQRSPSPQDHHHRESNTYASNDFEENDNITDNSQ